MVIYFVHFVLVLNIQSVLYIETTEGKLNRVSYEQLSVIKIGKINVQYSFTGKMRLPFIDNDLRYRGALYDRFDCC